MCQNCESQAAQAQTAEAQAIDQRQRVRVGAGLSVEAAFRNKVHESVETALAQLGRPVVTEDELREVIRGAVSGVLGNSTLGKQALAQTMKADQAKHHADENTAFFIGHDHFKIKPFATLDDAIVTGQKIATLVYENQSESVAYEADLVRAASMVSVLPPERKFEGLAELLAVVVMGFESEDLDDVKELVRNSLEQRASATVRKNTTEFLIERGFGKVSI